MRHMHEFGTTSEQLAEVAVSARKWASLNPDAMMRGPLSVEDVLSSRMISDPLHQLDACLVTDGGGAIVMTTADHARALGKTPVFVRGCGEANTHLTVSSMPDMARLTSAGEGGAFVSSSRTAPGGAFPMNTNGGGLSYAHPGMYGIFLLVEAVRQLRGECGPRQVKDAVNALVHGTGGTLSSGATCILSLK